MSKLRRGVIRALDSVGLKKPVRRGLNRVLAAGGLPPVGEPRVFRDLDRLARTPRPRPPSERGRLLIFTMRGWTTHVALEAMLGEAAAQRGMRPFFFTCGGPLPLCGITNFRAPDPTPCADCHGYVSRFFERLGFDAAELVDLVTEEEREQVRREVDGLADSELSSYEHEGLPLGGMVRTSVLWFLLRSTVRGDAEWVSATRRFLIAARVMRRAIDRLLERVRPDRVLCLNGLFFAERMLIALARRRGIPVTTYERGFMSDSWVFRHDEIACDYKIAADFLARGDRPLDDAQRERIDAYLEERAGGGVDAAQYWPRMEERRRELFEQLGLDPARPIVSVFSNIVWDSAVLDHHTAFENMFDWLESTVRVFDGRDDAQLVIRVHPAEVRLPGQETAERVRESLAERLDGIPASVRVVDADSELSSYTLGRASRFAIVYTSTMGLELAAAGIPVVVAGDTHYQGLGFTHDVGDRESYPGLLERLLREDPPAPDVERARRYAHFFFFEFMIPLGVTREIEGKQVRIPLDALDRLAPGGDPALDAVLDGLVEGRPIFLPSTDPAG